MVELLPLQAEIITHWDFGVPDLFSTGPRLPKQITASQPSFNFLKKFKNFMSMLTACIPACQKTASNPITDGCKPPPCGCWELNQGPLEKQPVPLTSEPSPRPLSSAFILECNLYKYGCYVMSHDREQCTPISSLTVFLLYFRVSHAFLALLWHCWFYLTVWFPCACHTHESQINPFI